MAKIIDGKAIAKEVREGLRVEIDELKNKHNQSPGLAVVLVGDDPASSVYVNFKKKACAEVGITSFEHRLDAATDEAKLISLIEELNADPAVNGILVQLPLPDGFSEERVLETITPDKDVDGFHPYNVGRLVTGNPIFEPCTPLGIMTLLESTGVSLEGKEAVVLGRSNIVGKPMAFMLLKKNATVTICHSRTHDLPGRVRAADVVIAAVGIPDMVKGDWIKEGAVVIDVGINRTEDGKLTGDVDYEEALERAGHITPVPGGVGPMTIATLLANTVSGFKRTLAGND